ncbi:MAG: hypothetical protein ACXWP1_05545, partial [Bdellovibrionota bacterium]
MKKIIIASSLTLLAIWGGLTSGTAHAGNADSAVPDYYRLQPAKVVEVPPTASELYSDAVLPNPSSLPDLQTFDWGTITAIGEKVIEIVKAGKPVVNVTRDVVSVVPGGITDWSQMNGWQAPITKVYSVTAKNNLGMTVVDLRLKVSANCGGGLNGKGKFIANLVVVPTSIYVLWGFSADVFSEHQDPVNVGTSSNPVAGMGFDIRYKYGSPLVQQEGTADYFVSGDGT